MTDRTEVQAAWVIGLAQNPAMPTALAERVFALVPLPGDESDWLRRLPLPRASAAAAVAHPDRRVREQVAGNPSVPGDLLGRLAADPDPEVRARCARTAVEHETVLPTEAVAALADDPSDVLRKRAAMLSGPHDEVRLRLALDREPGVRARVLMCHPHLWELLPAAAREELRADLDPRVERAVWECRHADRPLPRTVPEYLAERDPARRAVVAARGELDLELAAALARDANPTVRASVARNEHLPLDLARRLATDPSPSVRLAASTAEGFTEAERAAIDYTVTDEQHPVIAWVFAHRTDPSALRRAAASAHVLLRRSVASLPRLPADIVELLARDPDFTVRHTLCHACLDTPHDVLVAMYASDDNQDWILLGHAPGFARPGLARFADDPNERLRRAALLDPQAGPDLVERLSHDPAPAVRHAAGLDPRLPLDRLTELLADADGARYAAANPALPADRMRQLIEVVAAERAGEEDRRTG